MKGVIYIIGSGIMVILWSVASSIGESDALFAGSLILAFMALAEFSSSSKK